MRNDLLAVFEQRATRLGAPDHVIIGPTQLAAPIPVRRVFEKPSARGVFALAGVITVVDAGQLADALTELDTCAAQIAAADLLILNKADRQHHSALEDTQPQRRQLDLLAEIIRASQARVDVHRGLGHRKVAADLLPAHVQEPHHRRHTAAIQAVAVELGGAVDMGAGTLCLDRHTRRRARNPLRMKGILAVPEHPRRFAFQGVQRVGHRRPERPWRTAPRQSRVVLIGRGLDPTVLQTGFMASRHAPSLADTRGGTHGGH